MPRLTGVTEEQFVALARLWKRVRAGSIEPSISILSRVKSRYREATHRLIDAIRTHDLLKNQRLSRVDSGKQLFLCNVADLEKKSAAFRLVTYNGVELDIVARGRDFEIVCLGQWLP